MAVGNTIGRMVGQSPAKKGSMNMANPVASMFQGLQALLPLWQQVQGMLQQLMGGGGGGGGGDGGGGGGGAPAGGAPGGGNASGRGDGRDAEGLRAPVETPGALRDQLTEAGRLLRTRPSDMEGAARADQAQTRAITDAIVQEALRASGPRGSAVPEATLQNASTRITELARAAPTPAQSAQAVDNAATQARMKGANGPVLQMLQQVLGMFQQLASLMGGAKQKSNGAQIRR